MALNKINLIRPQAFNNKVIFIDGFSGSGKSMIAPIVSSFHSSELWQLEHLFETCLTLYSLEEISLKATENLIKMFVDKHAINLMIGRNINYRETDDSSAQKNLLEERYIMRSKGPEGDKATEMINTKKPINIFMTHDILGISSPLFSSLGDKLKLFIVPIRHPYWLLENWVNNLWYERVGKDPRELSITYEFNGRIYPSYAKGWEDKYDNCSPYEKAIEIIYLHQKTLSKSYSEAIESKILLIPFEKFATNPEKFIRQINSKLNSKKSDSTNRIMKKMNVPREFSEDFISKQKKSLFNTLKTNKISTEYKKLLEELAYSYETKYLEIKT